MLITISQLMDSVNKTVTCLDCHAAAKQRRQDNGLLIDVRETSEHAQGAVSGALNFPRGVLEMKILAHETNPQRPIYLHCASTVRAKLAAEQLLRLGYQQVYVINGELNEIIHSHS